MGLPLSSSVLVQLQASYSSPYPTKPASSMYLFLMSFAKEIALRSQYQSSSEAEDLIQKQGPIIHVMATSLREFLHEREAERLQ